MSTLCEPTTASDKTIQSIRYDSDEVFRWKTAASSLRFSIEMKKISVQCARERLEQVEDQLLTLKIEEQIVLAKLRDASGSDFPRRRL